MRSAAVCLLALLFQHFLHCKHPCVQPWGWFNMGQFVSWDGALQSQSHPWHTAPPTVQGYCTVPMRQEHKVSWMGIRKGKIISLWQHLKSASPALWNMLLTKAPCSNRTSALYSGLVTGVFVLHPHKIGSDTLLPLQTRHQAELCPHLQFT